MAEGNKASGNILERIVARRQESVDVLKRLVPLSDVKNRIEDTEAPRGFLGAVSKKNEVNLIAELKKASPSKGLIREDFRPVGLAREFSKGGAAAISVLTEPYFFQGKPEFLQEVKKEVGLPLLRKDFIFDQYQVYESRALGADAVLLIASILELNSLRELMDLACQLEMDCVMEIHTEKELGLALEAGAKLIQINNRNLKTFDTNLSTSARLAKMIPDSVTVVSASGINDREDIELLLSHNINTFLIGESLMRSNNIVLKLRELLGVRNTYNK